MGYPDQMRNRPQYKNPKFEIRNPKQNRNPNFQMTKTKKVKVEGYFQYGV